MVAAACAGSSGYVRRGAGPMWARTARSAIRPREDHALVRTEDEPSAGIALSRIAMRADLRPPAPRSDGAEIDRSLLAHEIDEDQQVVAAATRPGEHVGVATVKAAHRAALE